MANSWGDYCTYCGLPMSGEFPRKCDNGHYTYTAPVTVGVALQPVIVGAKTGILVVQRNINPYKGEYALPGGFVDNKETSRPASVRELSEETPIKNNVDQAVYFSEANGGSHNPADPRSHSMYFYAMPVLQLNEIDFNFENEEVQGLKILYLADDGQALQNENAEHVALCFSTHHNAAIEFLKSY